MKIYELAASKSSPMYGCAGKVHVRKGRERGVQKSQNPKNNTGLKER